MVSSVEFTVYPDDCDAFGHLNEASLLAMFERARWEALAQGPGMDLFKRHGVWPAVRRATIDFLRPAYPGDRLRFELEVTRLGETSFSMRQRARRLPDAGLAAEADFVLVTVASDGRAVPVPTEVAQVFGVSRARVTGAAQQYAVRGLATTVDISGEGPPVLFVHGFPLDRTMWRPVASALTGWRRILPDLRGLGLSEGPQDGHTMAEYADDLAALMDVLRVPKAVVCGLSMGGYVAFELLRRHPERVRALVLANTRAAPDDADGRAKRDATIARIRRDGPGFLADEMLPKLVGSDTARTMPDVVRQVRAMVSGQPAAGLVGALTAMRDRPDSRPMLGGITLPALVVHGSDDQLIPLAEARAMADAIPDAHFAVIPAAGHLAPLEQAVNTGRVIREFLEALL